MRKEIAIEVIKDFQERAFPRIIDRDVTVKLPRPGRAITITGPRRTGKTYFLYNTMARLEGVSRAHMLYINLEDDRLFPPKLEDLDYLMRTYYELHPDGKGRTVHVFLDEVQNVDDWERFVRRVIDTEDVQVFITGSSSRLLADEIATSMRGRSDTYTILPFSFPEFLRARGMGSEEYLSSRARSRVMNALNEFVRFGGFPEVVMDEDELSRIRTLKGYVDVMLLRDIAERYSIKNTRVLKMMFSHLSGSFSKEFSIHGFFRFLKSQRMEVSKNTLYDYFQHLEDAFAIIPVRRFSHGIREMGQSIPKLYLIDSGFAAQTGLRTSDNTGRMMENAVAVELFRRRASDPLTDFYYWKNQYGSEVDFVIKQGTEISELVQVCYDIGDYETRRRETRALTSASDVLKCKALKVLTWDREEEETINGRRISYVPLWKWFLGYDH